MPSVGSTSTIICASSGCKEMDLALWLVQALLAVLFLVAGGMKVLAYDRMAAMASKQNPDQGLPMSRGLAGFVGVSEVAGALGLVLPWGLGVLPVLTPLAAVGLAIIMAGAIVKTMAHQSPTFPAATLVLCLIVAAGRGLLL